MAYSLRSSIPGTGADEGLSGIGAGGGSGGSPPRVGPMGSVGLGTAREGAPNPPCLGRGAPRVHQRAFPLGLHGRERDGEQRWGE